MAQVLDYNLIVPIDMPPYFAYFTHAFAGLPKASQGSLVKVFMNLC